MHGNGHELKNKKFDIIPCTDNEECYHALAVNSLVFCNHTHFKIFKKDVFMGNIKIGEIEHTTHAPTTAIIKLEIYVYKFGHVKIIS